MRPPRNIKDKLAVDKRVYECAAVAYSRFIVNEKQDDAFEG